MRRLTVVIAAYDEEANVEPLTRRLHRTLSGLPGWEWEVLYVVEGTDGTRAVIERLAAELGHVRLLYSEAPSGLGAAFRRGFAAVADDVDVVVTMDADLNHQPEEIPSLLAALDETGSDIVVGSRFVTGSSVRGAPLWKRFLSNTMNLLMRWLYGLKVGDKTSGFRAYRATALHAIHFENRNFAFLPEMLIRAHRQGSSISETPIHFVFRREGRSKLRFWSTSLSYLTLLRARFDRVSLLALFAYLLALVVRLTAAFPVHKYPADADALLAGLCAFKVLRGETPVFFAPLRIGSLECHVAATLFALAGPSRVTLLVTSLVIGLAFLVAAHLFFRETLGRTLAAVALLALAAPAPSVLFWTYVPNGYPGVLALSAIVLWLAARLARTGGSLSALGFGFAAGLGFWHSFLTLPASAPATLWLAARPSRGRNLRVAGLALAGFLAGASPWIAFNVRWPWATFDGNFASRPASGPDAMAENAVYLATENVPELLAADDPTHLEMPATTGQRALRPVVLSVWVLALAVLLFAPVLPRCVAPPVSRASWALLVLVLLAVVAANVFSEAGELRGLTVRYVLPLELPAVAALVMLAAVLWQLRREVAVATVALVVVYGLLGHPWPWRAVREKWRRYALEDRQLVGVLERQGIDIVVGGYWTVYPLLFLSRERIIAIPCEPGHDHYKYADRIPAEPLRWAFVAWPRGDKDESWIDLAAASGAIPGRYERSAPGFVVYYPEPNPPAALNDEFLQTARERCHARPY